MWESKAWGVLKELLSIITLLVLLLGLWSAVASLEKKIERAEVESERRFKSLEQMILQEVKAEKWTNKTERTMQRLQNLSP
jgi:hypothetical protein